MGTAPARTSVGTLSAQVRSVGSASAPLRKAKASASSAARRLQTQRGYSGARPVVLQVRLAVPTDSACPATSAPKQIPHPAVEPSVAPHQAERLLPDSVASVGPWSRAEALAQPVNSQLVRPATATPIARATRRAARSVLAS